MMHAYHYIGGFEQYLCREPGEEWLVRCTCKDYKRKSHRNAKQNCIHVPQALRQQLKDDTAAYNKRIRGADASPPAKRARVDLGQFAFSPTKQ